MKTDLISAKEASETLGVNVRTVHRCRSKMSHDQYETTVLPNGKNQYFYDPNILLQHLSKQNSGFQTKEKFEDKIKKMEMRSDKTQDSMAGAMRQLGGGLGLLQQEKEMLVNQLAETNARHEQQSIEASIRHQNQINKLQDKHEMQLSNEREIGEKQFMKGGIIVGMSTFFIGIAISAIAIGVILTQLNVL